MKAARTILYTIVNDIAARDFKAGDRLATLGDMKKAYGGSRSSLQQALSFLELGGLIRLRPGIGGGGTVGEAMGANLAAVSAPFLCMAKATCGDLLDAWVTTEPLLAAAAARNADRALIGRLFGPYAKLATAAEQDAVFRGALVEGAANPALSLPVESIACLVVEVYGAATHGEPPPSLGRDEQGALAAAILAGEAGEAARLLEAELRRIAGVMRQRIDQADSQALARELLVNAFVGNGGRRFNPLDDGSRRT